MIKYPKIALDMDGVIVDFHQRLIDTYNKRYKDPLTVKDIDCDIESLGPDLSKKLLNIFNEKGYFLKLKPFPDAVHIVSQYLDLGYKVTICTAPARELTGFINPNSAAEKFVWIRKWLPFWANDIIITKNKEWVAADMLIDDTAHNIVGWCKEHPSGIGYLINQPWNQKFKSYPTNCIRGSLAGVPAFFDRFWCQERGVFAYRLGEFHQGWH